MSVDQFNEWRSESWPCGVRLRIVLSKVVWQYWLRVRWSESYWIKRTKTIESRGEKSSVKIWVLIWWREHRLVDSAESDTDESSEPFTEIIEYNCSAVLSFVCFLRTATLIRILFCLFPKLLNRLGNNANHEGFLDIRTKISPGG